MSLISKEYIYILNESKTLRKKRLYPELFWSVFSRIRTEYKDLLFKLTLSYHFSTLHSPSIPFQTVYRATPQKSSLLEKLCCCNFTPKIEIL